MFKTSFKDSKGFRKGVEATTKTVVSYEGDIAAYVTEKLGKVEAAELLSYGFAVKHVQTARDGGLVELKKKYPELVIQEDVPVDVPDNEAKDLLKLVKASGMNMADLIAMIKTQKAAPIV